MNDAGFRFPTKCFKEDVLPALGGVLVFMATSAGSLLLDISSRPHSVSSAAGPQVRLARVSQHLAGGTRLSRFSTFRATAMSAGDEKKDGSTKWSSNDGRFRRQVSSFRDFISSAPDAKFKPELNRYHLVTAMACPWAHRTMIVRKLKGIDKVDGLLPLHTVDSLLGPEGWSFVPYEEPKGLGVPGTGIHIPGHENKKRIRELYLAADPEYAARCTVPIIWDNKNNTIVSNESSEIIRMLNTCFDDFIPGNKKGLTYYPEEDKSLQKEIDALNEWIYPDVNNGARACTRMRLQDVSSR